MPPDNVEDLYDDLENFNAGEVSLFVSRLSVTEAGWLGRFIRQKSIKEREIFHETVQRELRVCVFIDYGTLLILTREVFM